MVGLLSLRVHGMDRGQGPGTCSMLGGASVQLLLLSERLLALFSSGY